MRRFVRVEIAGAQHYGELSGDTVRLLSAAPWHGGVHAGESVPSAKVRWLCPAQPSKIIGIGRNYREHAKELGNEPPKEPLMFLKAPSALCPPGATVVLPSVSERVDYEGELAVVIGRRARRVSAEDALDYVFGYAVACDVTARDLQNKDGQWTRAKSFDSFCPLSSVVTETRHAADLELITKVNGEVRQRARTSSMVFSVPELVSYASGVMTLEPGDLILTGTPEGVAPMSAGELVSVAIEGLGDLSFRVAAE